MLLKAAANVVQKEKRIKFVIIGEGSLKDELLNLRKELGLDSNLEFIDYKKNIYDYFRNFDLKVQTSLWEGISYVVLEAMALGTPVIALSTESTSGVKEIILEGETGHLIFKDYVDTLAERILSLYNDPEKLKSMGLNSRRRILDKFTERNTASDMDSHYLESLS